MGQGEFLKAMLGEDLNDAGGPYIHRFVPSDPWEGWQEGDPEPHEPSLTVELAQPQ